MGELIQEHVMGRKTIKNINVRIKSVLNNKLNQVIEKVRIGSKKISSLR